jgi:hypothetical protein
MAGRRLLVRDDAREALAMGVIDTASDPGKP